MHKKHVVVVGAGMGGLTSALRLSHYGYEVTVLDSQAQAGGKVHTREVAGSKIDSGPTVFTMRWVFDALLRSVGCFLYLVDQAALQLKGRNQQFVEARDLALIG